MKAAILQSPRRFVVEELPLPTPGPGDVLVKVQACGVCTGEVGMYEGKSPGLEYPRFIGHEVGGIIEAVGGEVSRFAAGDRVVLFAEGKGYAEYVTVPESRALKLAPSTKFDLALGEPIACATNGVRKAAPELGESVALVGCGFMGLIMLQVFRARGAGAVIAIDTRSDMLDLAGRLGASHLLNPLTDRIETTVKELTSGRGVDIGVETGGNQATLDLAAAVTRMEGALEIFGFHQGLPRQVDLGYWNWMAYRIVNGHSRSASVYMEGMRQGIALLEAGQLSMEPLVTHRFALSEINGAFEMASKKPEGFVKGVIMF